MQRRWFRFCEPRMTETFDVVIAGGAVMGSSLAFHLANNPDFDGSILVIDPDFTYAHSASALSASSIRQQFSSAVNIQISLHGIAFLRAVEDHLALDQEKPAIGLKEGGYLYLAASDGGAALLSELNSIQRHHGADIALLSPQDIAARFEYIKTADLTAGSLGLSGEGWFDGYGLMQAFRKKARSLGVHFRQTRVNHLTVERGRITQVQCEDSSTLACGSFVNLAGASGARAVAAMAGVSIPVYAKKRCVFPFTCKSSTPNLPLLIDTSGVWVRPEGDGYIAGFSPADDDTVDHGADFEVDWSIFEEIIWPALATRIPAFESIKPGNAWAGHYDMCLLDHNAIIGQMGDLSNGFMAAGFSGHGLQQSPAVGGGLAELIMHGRYMTLDLSDLSFARIATNRPIIEQNII
jgi:FAD-dependent oxidoreductase domain-containing protein 1